MTRHAAFLSTTLAALGLVSCAAPCVSKPPAVTQTAPVSIPQASHPPIPLAPPAPTPGRVTSIPLGTLFELQQADNALIIDVRPSFIHHLGHIPGALNWPRGNFDGLLTINEPRLRQAALARKPAVLYCTDLACPDALEVANQLASRGHSVAVLEGGWDAWKAGDLPTE